jgi:hypothetical protein
VQPGHTNFKAEKPLKKQAPTEEISLCKAVKAVVFSQAYKQSGGLSLSNYKSKSLKIISK